MMEQSAPAGSLQIMRYLGGVTSTSGGRASAQRDLSRLENSHEVQKGETQPCVWSGIAPGTNPCWDRLVVKQLGRGTLGSYWTSWTWTSNALLWQRRPTASWAALRTVLQAGQGGWSLLATLVRLHLEYCIQFPSTTEIERIQEQVQCGATKLMKGLEHLLQEERPRELGMFSLEKRWLMWGILPMCTNKRDPHSSQ